MPGSADISKNRKFQLRLINKVKNSLKNDDVFKDMCKECGVSIDVIDLIPVKFGNNMRYGLKRLCLIGCLYLEVGRFDGGVFTIG